MTLEHREEFISRSRNKITFDWNITELILV